MTHTLQTNECNSLVSIPIRYLLQSIWRKRWLFFLIIFFTVFSNLPSLSFNPKTSILQVATATAAPLAVHHDEIFAVQSPQLSDKITKFILIENKNIDQDTAHELADAIIDGNNYYHIPIEIQLGLIKTESRFQQYAISSAGALGWYQIMPSVHSSTLQKMLKAREISTQNLYDPETQAMLGNKILHDCLRIYHQRIVRALQCYNGSNKTTKYARDVLGYAKDAKEFLNSTH